jgi:hypothetical protein
MTLTPQPIPSKFKPLTTVKRGHMTSHLPRKFADTNRKLALSIEKKEG